MNIYAQRLLNVARALRESPNPDRFDMRRITHPCGTPACAFGHYISRNDLQDEFAPDRGNSFLANGVETDGISGPAVLEHFGITNAEATRLFGAFTGCNGAQTANAAAEYIEAFVARKYPAPMRIDAAPNWQAIATGEVKDSARDQALDWVGA